jgi:hypothetical protein
MRAGNINVDPCNRGRGSQAAKGESCQTPVDKFTDVVRLDYPAHCADGGVTSAKFARSIDPVQWRESNIATHARHRFGVGPQQFDNVVIDAKCRRAFIVFPLCEPTYAE